MWDAAARSLERIGSAMFLAVYVLGRQRPVRYGGILNLCGDDDVHDDGATGGNVLDALSLDGEQNALGLADGCEPRPVLVGHLNELTTEPHRCRTRRSTCRRRHEHRAQHGLQSNLQG